MESRSVEWALNESPWLHIASPAGPWVLDGDEIAIGDGVSADDVADVGGIHWSPRETEDAPVLAVSMLVRCSCMEAWYFTSKAFWGRTANCQASEVGETRRGARRYRTTGTLCHEA